MLCRLCSIISFKQMFKKNRAPSEWDENKTIKVLKKSHFLKLLLPIHKDYLIFTA